RIRAVGDGGGAPVAGSPRSRAWWQRAWKGLVAGGVAVAATVTAALALPGGGDERPKGAPVRVFNVEKPCQRSMSLNCRLGLAGDPYAKYNAYNVTYRVRHDDRLVAECYIADGTPVRAEKGPPSARWYRVQIPSGTAWLPAVRVWPGTTPAVGRCA